MARMAELLRALRVSNECEPSAGSPHHHLRCGLPVARVGLRLVAIARNPKHPI